MNPDFLIFPNCRPWLIMCIYINRLTLQVFIECNKKKENKTKKKVLTAMYILIVRTVL